MLTIFVFLKAYTMTFTASCFETNYDYMYIYDGDSDAAPELAAHSSCELLEPITTGNSVLYIHLTSDGSVTRAGFSGTFACPPPPGMTSDI